MGRLRGEEPGPGAHVRRAQDPARAGRGPETLSHQEPRPDFRRGGGAAASMGMQQLDVPQHLRRRQGALHQGAHGAPNPNPNPNPLHQGAHTVLPPAPQGPPLCAPFPLLLFTAVPSGMRLSPVSCRYLCS